MNIKNNIDVVLLSWNRVENTIQAARNVLSQIGVNVFIWIIDQGSDRYNLNILCDALKQENRVKLVKLDKNYGVPGGRNRGIALGNADLIVCLDNDAEFKNENCLLNIIDQFEGNPKLAALGFRIENYFTHELDRLSWVYPRQLRTRSSEPFLATRFCGAGHALRRSAWDLTNGYDETLFFYWEELDLSYQLLNFGFEIAYDPNIVVLHKLSPDARVDWHSGRFYYLVRNAIYLDWKFFHSMKHVMVLIMGYMVKGLYNGIFAQTFRGVRDGLDMCIRYSDTTHILSPTAHNYILKNDLKYRGNFIDRLKQEVLEKIR